MSHNIKHTKENLGETENAKDDSKMFKAGKVLYTKQQRVCT